MSSLLLDSYSRNRKKRGWVKIVDRIAHVYLHLKYGMNKVHLTLVFILVFFLCFFFCYELVKTFFFSVTLC